MKTLFSSDVRRIISGLEYGFLASATLSAESSFVYEYKQEYPERRSKHDTYFRGWHASFFEEQRFMNLVLMHLFEIGCIPRSMKVLDIGCYDAALVAFLRRMGIEAYGFDKIPWGEMWDFLQVADCVNVAHPPIDIAVVFDYAHNWHPRDMRAVVRKISGHHPRVILMDREARNPRNHEFWMDDDLLNSCGITVVNLPKCRKSIDSDRNLLIMEADDV
jgi:hypothetical protein